MRSFVMLEASCVLLCSVYLHSARITGGHTAAGSGPPNCSWQLVLVAVPVLIGFEAEALTIRQSTGLLSVG